MIMKRKLHNKAGFTLGEVLVAILILLMMSTIVAAGIPLAKRAYDKVTVGANAQVLLSTTVTALRDQLGTAQDIDVVKRVPAEGGSAKGIELTYYSSDTNSRAKLFLGDGTAEIPNGILIQPYTDITLGAKKSEFWPLVSSKAATSGMYVTYDEVSYNETAGLVTFENLRVNWTITTSTGPSLDTLVIRVISAS